MLMRNLRTFSATYSTPELSTVNATGCVNPEMEVELTTASPARAATTASILRCGLRADRKAAEKKSGTYL